MKRLHFIDANILLYSISRTSSESLKRAKAVEILDRENGALSVQVLQEFFVQATCATRVDRVPDHLAAGLISTWLRFEVQEITTALLIAALDVKAKFGFSYWDSAIIAAAQSLGCGVLYSEDMRHGQEVGGVRIVNPFVD